MERRLVAILAADVVGYSALMERDEAGTFARLQAGRKELFEPEIARHHGRIFKLMGDGLLAEFGSVVDAVECAVSLQRGLAERNASVPESERIQVRIGINLGEVIVEGDDRYGEGVNIATRLEQLAEAGDVYVSGKVAKEVAKRLAFGFEAMGEQTVKNIAEPVSIYRVKFDGDAARTPQKPSPRATRARMLAAVLAALVLVAIGAAYGIMRWQDQQSGSARTEKPSIAVLPFANLSDDTQQGYFADGIAEDLMTDLSRLSGLFVVSRNSAFAYRGNALDLRAIGRELGVRYIVEGSVRRAGDQVRINVQLIDVETGGHQWAERYDGSQADIFALQDKVTKAVVTALELQLTSGEQVAMGQLQTNVPEAYDSFLRGWAHYQRTTPQDFVQAIPYFERAIELDPNYGRAHAALAMVYFRSYDQRWVGILGMSADSAFRKARDHLNIAKARPTSLSHQVAGNISRERGWYDDAFKEFAAAIALEPNDPWSYADLAYALIWAGRPAEAAAQIETAMRLDPQYPPVFVFYQGLVQFAQERLPEAAKAFEEAVRLNPEAPWVGLFLAATYGKSGRVKDAEAAVAAYSAARIRDGSVPFVMREVAHPTSGGEAPQDISPPEMTRLYQGLSLLSIPFNFDAPAYAEHRLKGSEIEALLFSHRPGGTRAKENEYFTFDGWANPFSPVD